MDISSNKAPTPIKMFCKYCLADVDALLEKEPVEERLGKYDIYYEKLVWKCPKCHRPVFDFDTMCLNEDTRTNTLLAEMDKDWNESIAKYASPVMEETLNNS